MVAVIKTGHSIRKILKYNEDKIERGEALCIGVSGYPKDLQDLSLNNKINRLVHQASLNPRVKKPIIHISLNFDPAEKLSIEKLNAITEDYMIGIGFSDQPYLIYQHLDTVHPHVHVVTIKVKEDGSCVKTHNLGRTKSNDARKTLEIQYDLISPERGKRISQKKSQAEKIMYGKISTVSAIEDVVDAILESYKYANLQEFNAILAQYNIMAHQGAENSKIRKNDGLVYRVLDQQGNKIGRPIRACDLRNTPTMKLLKTQFALNKEKPAEDRKQLINTIDLFFSNRSQSLEKVIDALSGIKINIIYSKNPEEDEVYYIDHITKCIFSSKDLGIGYDKMGIMKRFRS